MTMLIVIVTAMTTIPNKSRAADIFVALMHVTAAYDEHQRL